MKIHGLKGACIALLLTFAIPAIAQEEKSNATGNFKMLTWAQEDPVDWSTGGIFALLGIIGALTTIFGFIGGVIPGTAGKAKLEKDQAQLDVCMNRLEELIKSDDIDAAVVTAVQHAVNSMRDDISRERWWQFWVAMLLYAFLGSMFAAILADSYLQALVIGAGWTALIGTLGLKSDFKERKEEKDDLNKELINQIERLIGTPPHPTNGDDESPEGLIEPENGAKTPRSRSGSRSKNLLSTPNQSLVDEQEAFEKLKSKALVINKL